MTDLRVFLDGTPCGIVTMQGGSLSFQYEPSYLDQSNPTPLSLSMPLSTVKHGNRVTNAYLEGLLPDNVETRQGWSAQYGVSATSAFARFAQAQGRLW